MQHFMFFIPRKRSIEDAIEKLNYDLFCTKNMSFLLDLLIIFRTVKIVLFGKGAR
ncbi:MAG: sugar transferase [Deltaproteobacteria bacterium]|nr:sugar transferase [Deltaproteobacteria bacterium]